MVVTPSSGTAFTCDWVSRALSFASEESSAPESRASAMDLADERCERTDGGLFARDRASALAFHP
jgi:hypothetical protein